MFDGERIVVEGIRLEDEYSGSRAKIRGRCGTARLVLQIDMGLGDSVWPAPMGWDGRWWRVGNVSNFRP